jgi:formimidoylglutamate deiminase
MIKHFFSHLLTTNGWRQDVILEIDEAGTITSVQDGKESEASVPHTGYAVPGMANVHSHAFQRAMAGLAETSGNTADSFWSWRQVMYQFVSEISPEQLEAIAAQLYLEMLKSGFTSVGEFHYLHHDPAGRAYTDPSEMGRRLLAAAGQAGIGMTLLPVLYRYSGFGSLEALDYQKRFTCSADLYLNMIEALTETYGENPNQVIGVAPHSLRAVDPDLLAELLNNIPENTPRHIHIAEQVKEVEDCLDWSGQRPVEWLAGHVELDERWCLIHATHVTDNELDQIATSGSVVGLCPITEANLGDGIFPATEFQQKHGRIALGSDSNVLVSLPEECRLLEYGQRLTRQSRNLLGNGHHSTGQGLFETAVAGGHQALGRPGKPGVQVGGQGNFVVLDPNHSALTGKPLSAILDSWIFAGDHAVVKDVAVDGKLVVTDRCHEEEASITERFSTVMKELTASL